MKFRFAAAAVASLLLSGCADSGFSFDDILGFPDASGDVETGAPAPVNMPVSSSGAPVVAAQTGSATASTGQAEAPSTFCRGVATQDATQNAFDGPTQAKIAQKSYAQCVAQFSAN